MLSRHDILCKVAELNPEVVLHYVQQHGVQRFLENDGQILLAYGTGTGKTLTAIAAFEEGKKKKKAHRALVITPTPLRQNFIDSIRKFTNSTINVLGSDAEVQAGLATPLDSPPADYNVIGIEMFRENPEALIRQFGIDTIIFDEAHKFRNPKGETYDLLMRIRPLVRNAIALTATETSNHPKDILPLLDFITNKTHGLGDQKDFSERYFEPTGEKTPGMFKGKKAVYRLRPGAEEELQQHLGKWVDFIDISDIAKELFPRRDVEYVEVPMSAHQESLYDYALDRAGPLAKELVKSGVPPKNKDLKHVFTQLQIAREVSNAIHIMDEKIDLSQSARETPKIKRLLDDLEEHLKSTPDAQIVVGTQFIHGGIDVLRAGLEDRKIPYGIFIGKQHEGSSEPERQQALNDYRAGKVKVLLLSSAGTEGIDLPNTTMVQILDGHFNPAVIQQMEARGVRAGGLKKRAPEKRIVQVKRYISTRFGEPSVDQWVYGVAGAKKKLISSFREVLQKANKKIYERANYLEGLRPTRLESPETPISPPPASEVLHAPAQETMPAPGTAENLAIRPHRYVRRWQSPSGEWRYEYPKTALLRKLASRVSVREHLREGHPIRGYIRNQEEPPPPNEFAPGLPEKGRVTSLPLVSTPLIWEFCVQDHKAKKQHFDLRLGDPETGIAHSWAIPEAKLPEPGEKPLLAVRQGDHTLPYMDFKGEISEGYGKGTVALAERGRVEIVSSSPDAIKFNQYKGHDINEYRLWKWYGNNWLIRNFSPTRETHPEVPQDKPVYKETRPEKVSLDDPDEILQAKIDGSHAVISLSPKRQTRVFSWSPTKRKIGIIDHTHKIPGVQGHRASKETGETVLRGEIYATDKDGKALPVQTIGGMLNASVPKSRETQKEKGNLTIAIHNVIRYRGKDVWDLSYEDKLKIMRKIVDSETPLFHLPDTAESPEEKKRLYEAIIKGVHPQTEEGLIVWRRRGPHPPTKAKKESDLDVKIVGVFPGRGQYEGNGIGGFIIEHKGVTSEIGTGLSQRLRRRAYSNPEDFLGMVIKVKAHQVFPSGKIRMGRFKGFHIDKNDIDRLNRVLYLEKQSSLIDLLGDTYKCCHRASV